LGTLEEAPQFPWGAALRDNALEEGRERSAFVLGERQVAVEKLGRMTFKGRRAYPSAFRQGSPPTHFQALLSEQNWRHPLQELGMDPGDPTLELSAFGSLERLSTSQPLDVSGDELPK
jgi:hypothetical protein